MEAIPTPLVGADVDLRGYEFVPLFGDRLFGSETWISATADAKVAALRLWWRAYAKEVPASSLPNNDQLLAEYAGYGVMLQAWRKIKSQALRGFVLCSDGRWYHPFMAELALDAWKGRRAHQLRTAKARIAVLEKRHREVTTEADRAHLEDLIRDLQQSLSPSLLQTAGESVTDEKCTSLHLLQGSTETERGEGQGEKISSSGGKWAAVGDATNGRAAAIARLVRDLEKGRSKASRCMSTDPRVQAWAQRGVTEEQLREAYALAVADRAVNHDQGAINTGFLDIFLARVLNPCATTSRIAAADAATLDWWTTAQGVFAKARELNIEIVQRHPDLGDGGDVLATKCRIAAELGDGPWINPRNATEQRLIESFRTR